METILKNFIEIIGNTFDAHSVCYFEKDDDYLILKYHFSLSKNIRENAKLKIGESLIGWIAKNRKPVNLKGDKTDYKILEVYKSNEDIKSFLILPVGKIGVLYIDSKRMYSITEKQQKLLQFYSKFFENLLRYLNEFKIYKERLRLLELLKKIDNENIINFLCKSFNFEWGAIIKREGEKFKIISNNYNGKLPEIIDMCESKLGIIINKEIKKISFFNRSKFLFSKNENLSEIKNFLFIPFVKHGVIVSSIVLVNSTSTKEEILKEFTYLYKILEIFCFNRILIEEIKKSRKIQRDSYFVNQIYFFNNLDRYKGKGFIVFKIKNFHKLIKKYAPEKILYSFRKFKGLTESLINTDIEGIIFSLNTFVFVLNSEILDKVKKIIEKNLKNTYLKIDNKEENVNFNITCFKDYNQLIKFIYNVE